MIEKKRELTEWDKRVFRMIVNFFYIFLVFFGWFIIVFVIIQNLNGGF
jgi:hypothetical protein